MKRSIALICLLSAFFFPAIGFSKEPTNLAVIKKQLMQYHDNGDYEADINVINKQALDYLKQRVSKSNFNGKKPAIVLDIDETSLSNYDDMVKLNFGGTLKEILASEDNGTDPAIQSTLTLYRYAVDHHVAVFFITGRFEYERKPTEKNLREAGYKTWDKLILRNGEYKTAPAAKYKTTIRKQLASQGYNILINIGDQYSDLEGGYADKTYKLPNPYYFIP